MEKKNKVYQSFNMKAKSSNEDTREIEAVASVQTKDRDGDIVFLDGLDISNFKKNQGPILWSHDTLSPPLAKVTKVYVEGKKLIMKIKFPDESEYGFADTIYKLIKGGFINSLSIGFKPDWEQAKFNEKNKGFDFKKSELLETSIVNVPSNSGAQIITRSLDDAITKNIIDEVEKNEVKLMLDELLTEETDVEQKSEQNIKLDTTPDDIEILKAKVRELELKLETTDLKEDTIDELYSWIFMDDLGFNKSKEVDPNDDLIEAVLKDLGIK